VHVVCGRGTLGEKLVADEYGRCLKVLAPRYGFGSVDTPVGRACSARESAAYISSYLASSRAPGGKRRLSETVRSSEMPRSIIHVSVDLTQKTGVTMRALRFRRLVYGRWKVNLGFLEQRNVQRLCDAFDGELLFDRGPPTLRVVS
jgi:hypothetical protein